MDQVQNDPHVIEVYLGREQMMRDSHGKISHGGSRALGCRPHGAPRDRAPVSWVAMAWEDHVAHHGPASHNVGRDHVRGDRLLALPAPGRARLGGLRASRAEIFPQLTVEENLRIGLGVRKNGHRTIPDRIFALFPVLKQMLNRRGGDLSGGQQQQLAIGRALVLEPTLLILDEPTEGIQPNIVHEIGDILLDLNRDAGLTVLVVEQQLRFARRVASRFCILERVVASPPVPSTS